MRRDSRSTGQITRAAVTVVLIAGMSGCATPQDAARTTEQTPTRAEIRQVDGRYQLYLNDEPFTVKGAGLEFGDVERLAAHGGNTFRTWRTDNGLNTGREVLDRAHQNGLFVVMGLEVARERPGDGRGYFGFDYDDETAVAAQLDRLRAEVEKYKDHPALIIWGIGNELNLGATNPRVWDAVNGISKMIHEVSPNHLTTTMLAGIGPELVHEIRTRAPDLDFLSVQAYAGIADMPRRIAESGWKGPYMITEWGATGHWEVPKTPWDAPIENNSSVKADLYLKRYQTAIASDTTQIIGSYVFLWGQKQERTPTWYGLFLPTGEATETVDVMHYIWNGEWPANRAPRLESATLDGRTAYDGIYLDAGRTYTAEVVSTDPDGDALMYLWEVREESRATTEGGDDEAEPQLMRGLIDQPAAPRITLTAPQKPGPYRLFVYVFDARGSAAHANIPFHVNQ
jgi:hypothetical protein